MTPEQFQPRSGWHVVERTAVKGGEDLWWPLIETVADTRSAAIAKLPGDPEEYPRRRRRREVKAVRVRLQPPGLS